MPCKSPDGTDVPEGSSVTMDGAVFKCEGGQWVELPSPMPDLTSATAPTHQLGDEIAFGNSAYRLTGVWKKTS
jgi:hypothetical protein